MNGGLDQGVPWGLLKRLGEGSITEEEVDGLAGLFMREGEEPPGWFITRARGVPQLEETPPERPGLVSRIKASLVFDSGWRLQPAGVRGGGAPVCRMSYAAEGLNLHLEAREEPLGRWTVSGQVLSDDGFGAQEVSMIPEGRRDPAVTTGVDDFGFFIVPDLSPFTYDMVLQGDDQVIEIPAVRVGTYTTRIERGR